MLTSTHTTAMGTSESAHTVKKERTAKKNDDMGCVRSCITRSSSVRSPMNIPTTICAAMHARVMRLLHCTAFVSLKAHPTFYNSDSSKHKRQLALWSGADGRKLSSSQTNARYCYMKNTSTQHNPAGEGLSVAVPCET